MMKKPLNYLLLLFLFLFAACEQQLPNSISIIPQPETIKVLNGHFKINADTKLLVDDNDFLPVANYLLEQIQLKSNIQIEIISDKVVPTDNCICLIKENSDAISDEEAYQMDVNGSNIVIKASHAKGIFWGVQSLFQLFPIETNNTLGELKEIIIPAVQITDKPRFSYRGMHLDVCRHIFPLDFIKQYIDLLAMYKFNTFHWHLTEDQGWRIEIKRYPKLAEIAAWRDSTLIGSYGDKPHKWDGKRYGGYYMQEEVKEIVKYAADRNITIIPEIELPGHSLAALAAYPELACTDGPFRPATLWGVFEDVYCPKDETFEFLEGVLTEVMELFPSEYIHIGGDECPKIRWKNCADCQQLMRNEGLQNEHELQSYFIRRIEKFLNKNGRKLIGWDEILEGGLSPNATVMSWRGIEGGIAAAKQGHDAIMTPGSHCYFDHYQANPDFEPLAIGGFTTLKKVYSYEPIPEELNAQEAKHILGSQANVWTEYIPSAEQVEYMILPRMLALAEVNWSQKDARNWDNFREKINAHFRRFDLMGLNYSRGSWKVDINLIKSGSQKQFKLALETEQPGHPVYYTLDNSAPTTNSHLYTAPFEIENSTTIKAAVFNKGKLMEAFSEKSINFHKAFGKPINLSVEPNARYKGNGAVSLVDGFSGSAKYNDGYWLGFLAKDLNLILNLGEEEPIESVLLNFYQKQASWIFLPVEVVVEVLDAQMNIVTSKTIFPLALPADENMIIESFKADFKDVNGQYIRVLGKNRIVCPEWHPAAGEEAWIFVDEVAVN